MAEVGTAFVTIVPSARGFGAALNAQTSTAAATAGSTSGKKYGGTFMGASKSALRGFAGIFAVGAVVQGIRSVTAEAREAQKVGAVTAQVIKATGGAANVTATQVSRLATAISNKTGVDDEQIQRGSNLLLTFKNVRNEAGKGADIFNRATAAAVDLAATGFGSIESNSKVLGKALQDPIKGMTALTRAGVTFSGKQKETIKRMVESGNVLGAQKLILKEVESQVGGTAAASATAGEKMRTAWNNAKESIGTALLPAIDKLENAITTKVIPAIVKFVGFLQKNPAIVKAFAIGIAAIAAAFVVAFIAANAIAVGIGVVAAALVYAYTKSETFRQVVQIVFSVVKTVVLTHMRIIVTAIKVGIVVIKAVWATIRAIVGFVRSAFNLTRSIITTAVNAVKTTVSNGVKNVVQFFRELPGKIVSALKSLAGKLRSAGSAAMTGLLNGLKAGAQRVYNMARSIANKVGSIIKSALKIRSPSKVMIEVGKNVTAGLAIGIQRNGPSVSSAMLSIADRAILPASGVSGPRLGTVAPATGGVLEASLVGARVEMGKDGFARFTDGRIRIHDQRGAIDARFAPR